jgi:hypothetical protein
LVPDRSGASRRGFELELGAGARCLESQSSSPIGAQKEARTPVSLFSGPVDPVALVGSVTALVVAVGGVVKQIRDGRKERRARKRNEKSLEQIARAAAKSSRPVAAVVDELERTGSFQRPTPGPDNDG